jgi:hypothetical protein
MIEASGSVCRFRRMGCVLRCTLARTRTQVECRIEHTETSDAMDRL